MIGGCITAVTAFIVINATLAPPAVLAAVPMVFMWLLPTLLGLPLIVRQVVPA